MRSSSSSIMESLFQHSLEDLIKGLRLNMMGECQYILKSMEEIRREIKSSDPETKSTALEKLSYLHSLHGVDMSWAAFHVLEVLASPRFSHKRIGYLAASQSFRQSTDILLLITNQLRKDLNSNLHFEVTLPLHFLSFLATPDLARDLTPDILNLLPTTRISIRKKVIALLFNLFISYPDAVKLSFKRLVDNLHSSHHPHSQALSSAVGLFCDLVPQDPLSYLPLAPEFFRILVDSKNNWVLIKVVKIFAYLVPLEPRLAKRVVDPICNHMSQTGATSLMFECVRAVLTSFTHFDSAVKLAVAKIRQLLLVDDDPNLKYLGLRALSLAAPNHLWAVLDNKEVVIKSLSDEDPNIKVESLKLVMAMVSENNVVEICRVLISYALKSDPGFCNEILQSILSTCRRNYYEIIVDFDWYVSLLGDISRIPHCQKGEEIESQLVDIGSRVKVVRMELARVSRGLLIDPALLGNPFLHRILSAAAWLSGEYVEFSRNPLELMEALLQPRTSLLPPSIRAVYIQSAFKVLNFCLYSYFVSGETVASAASCDELAAVSDSVSETKCPVDCPVDNDQDDGFNPRGADQLIEEFSIENGCNTSQIHGQTSFPAIAKVWSTHEPIVKLINLVEAALSPLSGCHEVEIQERARNVLGLIKLIQNSVQNIVNLDSEKQNASEVIELIQDALSEEFGPVSKSAQERVPTPDGLILKENLHDLETICGNVQFPTARSFSTITQQFGEGDSICTSSVFVGDESEVSNESTSLLAKHRKRHGLYYLPSEANDNVSTEYPPANETKLWDDDAQYLVKLTGQSLVAKRKQNHVKSRPVVLNLDEGNEVSIAAKKQESKEDTLSGAVRDVLLGNEAQLASLGRGKEKLNVDLPSRSNEENMGGLGPSSRKSKKNTDHGKQRRHRSSRQIGEGREENGNKDEHKSNHRDGKHRSGQRSEKPMSVVAQTQVIPDFLL